MNTPLHSDLDLLTQQINNPALLIFTESLTFMQTKQSCFLNNPFPCITNCVGPPALWFSKGQSAQLSYTYNSCHLKKNSSIDGYRQTQTGVLHLYICIEFLSFTLLLLEFLPWRNQTAPFSVIYSIHAFIQSFYTLTLYYKLPGTMLCLRNERKINCFHRPSDQ